MYIHYIYNIVSKHPEETGLLWYMVSEIFQSVPAGKACHQSQLHPWWQSLEMACPYGVDRKQRRQARVKTSQPSKAQPQ